MNKFPMYIFSLLALNLLFNGCGQSSQEKLIGKWKSIIFDYDRVEYTSKGGTFINVIDTLTMEVRITQDSLIC
ncbi:MAG: hypothetical protein ACI9J3_003708 [Parvicellaceae bacterium]|jgi:hypothetical protein